MSASGPSGPLVSFCCQGHARGGTSVCWGVKNFSMGICDGAPSTACSSQILHLHRSHDVEGTGLHFI